MSDTGAVQVDGLKDLLNALQRHGVAVTDMKSVMADVGTIVADDARPLTRPRSGVLAGTLRPSKTKTKAVVRAGGARAPYAGAQHFGWAARNIAPKLYLYTALDRRRADVLARFDRGLDNIIHDRKP
jgi:hypothetical protein